MSKQVQYFDFDYKDENKEKRNEINNIIIKPPIDNISVNEINLYIDKNYINMIGEKVYFRIPFLKSYKINSIYIRECIIIINNIDLQNFIDNNKFIVFRIHSLSNNTESITSIQTSSIDPSKDVIVSKSYMISPSYHFESKYLLKINNPILTNFIEIEILDENTQSIANDILNNFFIDLKISYLSYNL